MRIKESLESELGNCIYFSNYFLKGEKINKGETKVHYSLIKYKQKGTFKIAEDISENVTLVQLTDSLGNVNHAISVVEYWIFDSNYEKSLFLHRASLDIICAPSVGEEQAAKFETLFTAVRFILSAALLKE